jgi:hypothetical protein
VDPTSDWTRLGAAINPDGKTLDECSCESESACRCLRLDLASGHFERLDAPPTGLAIPENGPLTVRPPFGNFSARRKDDGVLVCEGPSCKVVPVGPVPPAREDMIPPDWTPSVSDDGTLLTVMREDGVGYADHRSVQLFDVASGRRLRTIEQRDRGYASGVYDGFLLDKTLFVVEDGSGPPVVGFLYDARTGGVLHRFDVFGGLFPYRTSTKSVWALVHGDGARIDWFDVTRGRQVASVAIDSAPDDSVASSEIRTLAIPGTSNVAIVISGSPASPPGTVFTVDLDGHHLLRRDPPPHCQATAP